MPKKERDIRIVGKRRAFDVGRFVVAIVAHAEALSDAEANTTETDRLMEKRGDKPGSSGPTNQDRPTPMPPESRPGDTR